MKCNEDCFNCVYDDCILGVKTITKKVAETRKKKKEYNKLKIGSDRTSEKYKKYHADYYQSHKEQFRDYRRRKRAEERENRIVNNIEPTFNFGAWLRGVRKELKLTQYQLGRRLYLEVTSISNYESGKVVPNLNTMQRIAGELGYEIQVVKKGS